MTKTASGTALGTLAFLSACGTATFTLPPAGEPAAGRYEWRLAEGFVHPRGDFDAERASAPAVFRFGQFYYGLYSAFDGAMWTTGLTASLDGLDWNLGRKVLAADSRTWEGSERAAFGSALVIDGLIHYWYTAGEPAQIGLARSHDGRSWRREEEPVLTPGREGAWDAGGVAHPAVVALDGGYFLFYVGTDAGGRAALGLARSNDGVRWTRLRANPLLSPGGEGGVAAWRAHGRYWLLSSAAPGRLALAHSSSGVEWTPAGLEFPGAMPSVLPAGGNAAVWYTDGGALAGGVLEWKPE